MELYKYSYYLCFLKAKQQTEIQYKKRTESYQSENSTKTNIMKFLTLTPENISTEHLCCTIGDKRCSNQNKILYLHSM
ncbi:hypothetical protein HMPREF9446_01561 [Bacteroides fluxus YIT 12057]|uniref:Uncharacterized protein n=1 Tax=Bacteroides fluxus YIT 12057 TaxID=763034 RepID=F3PSL6_9BACE|nr:hypothetical protein HMPREF9446_01561 [Bacteroides fluxus YIT 12057]